MTLKYFKVMFGVRKILRKKNQGYVWFKKELKKNEKKNSSKVVRKFFFFFFFYIFRKQSII